MKEKNSMFSGFAWKFLERSGVSVIHFLIQIVLARMLDPEYYGVLSVMMVFISIANLFVERGFQTALVQDKDVTEEDYSSVLWMALFVAACAYGIVFLCAPAIAVLFSAPGIEKPLRVLALMLFPGALNLVQQAKVTREMDFKKIFYCSTGGALVSGVVALVIAFLGGGLWALVVKTLLDVLAACIIMLFIVPIRFRFVMNFKRIKRLFSFGWKLLVSSIWNKLYGKLTTLIIGKRYNLEALAYYERGYQFPDLIINTVNQSVTSVILPVMSAEQDEPQKVKELMRNAIAMSAYILFPMMMGLAAVAEPLVRLVLTEKWLPCVPFMQVFCLALMTHPIDSCNLQAINAMGRSDIFLKLEIIKSVIDIPGLLFVVFYFKTPLAIAAYGLAMSWIYLLINAYPNKKLIDYTGWKQLWEVIPTICMSSVMCAVVLLFGNYCARLGVLDAVTLAGQVLLGVTVYALLSVVFKPYPFRMVLEILKKQLHGETQ